MSKLEIKSLPALIDRINELRIPFEEIVESKCNVKWDKNAKNFYEMGLDELDIIGVVLEIEEVFDINVWDFVVEELFNIKPETLVASRRRNDRLGDLGIE